MNDAGKNRKIWYNKVDTSRYGEVNIFEGLISKLSSSHDTFKEYKNKIKRKA